MLEQRELLSVNGVLQLTMSNPSPDVEDYFGISVDLAENTIITGAFRDDAIVNDSGTAYLFDAESGALKATLTNPSPDADDRFGVSVAVSGNIAVVGAYLDDQFAYDGGAVYLFDADTGALLRTLSSPNADPSVDNFGYSVAISGDLVVVGAYAANVGFTGEAYVFQASTGALISTLANPSPEVNDFFGYSVAISGSTVVVSAVEDDAVSANSGTAYTFDAYTGAHLATLNNPTPAANDLFGTHVAIHNDRVIVGANWDDTIATDTGSAYVFNALTGDLLLTLSNPSPDAGDNFGGRVAITESYIVVGTTRDDANGLDSGAVYIFDADTGELLETLSDPTPAAADRFGVVAAQGNRVLASSYFDDLGGVDSGSVYLYSIEAVTPTLSAVLEDGSLTVTDVDSLGKNNNLSLRLVDGGANIEISDTSEVFVEAPAGATLSNDGRTLTIPASLITGSLSFISNAGENALSIDFSLGNPIPSSGLFVNGGTDTDSVSLAGGQLYSTTLTQSNSNTGSLLLQPFGVSEPTIFFSDVESLSSDLVSEIVSLSYLDAGQTIEVSQGGNSKTVVATGPQNSFSFANPNERIEISATSGPNVVNVGTLSGDLPALRIVGGDEGSVNINGSLQFATNRYLDIDSGAVVLTNGQSDVQTSGYGTIHIDARRDIRLASGSSLTTVDGQISLMANGTYPAASGDFIGIELVNAQITSTGSGRISINGRGGDSAVGSQYGVAIRDGATVASTSENVYVFGYGGQSSGNGNFGILVTGSGTQVAGTSVELFANSLTIDNAAMIQADEFVLLNSGTLGVPINLGGADSLNATSPVLGISDAELDQITAPVIRVGGIFRGPITVSQSIHPANSNVLHLISGAGVSQTSPIYVSSLAVEAAGEISLQSSGNDVDTIALRTSVGNISFEDADGFTVGDVDGVSGVSAPAGRPNLLAFTGDIVITNTAAAIDVEGRAGLNTVINQFGSNTKFTLATGANISGGGVQITTDRMDLSGTINASNLVTLQPTTTSRLLQLGSATDVAVNTLELSDAELDRITTPVLRLGGFGTGTISIGQPINPAGSSTLHLVTAAGVTQSSAITVSNLAVQASGTVNLSSNNNANTVALRTTAGNLSYTDSDGFTIGTVNGVSGFSASAGSPSLTAFSGDVVVSNTPAAVDLEGAAGYNMNVTLLGANAKFTIASGASMTGAGAQITADRMDIAGNISTTATTTLQPISSGRLVNLGSATDAAANTLELSDAELDRITTSNLRIGMSAGTITVSTDITRPTASAMQLISNGDILISGGQVHTNGGTLLLDPGMSPAAVRPTTSGTDVTASTLSFAGDLAFNIDGAAADTQYTQLKVNGSVNLSGASLKLSGNYAPSPSDSFQIVDNDGTESIIATFEGLPEGSTVTFGGLPFQITYQGGDGNDVVLRRMPQVNLSVSQNTGSESELTQITVTATTDFPVSGDQTVDLTVAGLRITASDYNLTDADPVKPGVQILIPNGQTSGSVTFQVADDQVYEGNEQAALLIANPTSGLALGATTSGTITLIDDESIPQVSFSTTGTDVKEDAGEISIGVRLNRLSAFDTIVPLTFAGSASSPSDYSLTGSMSITIPAGMLSASLPLTIVDNVFVEAVEYISIGIGQPINAVPATQAGTAINHVVTIRDDDVLSVAFDKSSMSVNESDGQATVTVVLQGTSNSPVSVSLLTNDYSTASNSSDHTLPATTTLSFAPNIANPTASITFGLVNDLVSESTEHLYLRLGTPVGGGATLGSNQTLDLTILDDDLSEVQFGNASGVVTKSSVWESVGTATIPLRLSNPSANPIDVTIRTTGVTATAMSDFGSVPTTVRFNPGETVKTFSVPIVNDSANEINETVSLSIVSASGAQVGNAKQYTLTIFDNDPLIGLVPNSDAYDAAVAKYKQDYLNVAMYNAFSIFDKPYPELSSYVVGLGNLPIVAEGSETTMTVALSAITDHPVRVNLSRSGTATTSDYTISAVSPATLSTSGLLTIPAGTKSVTIKVKALNDNLVEKSESLNVQIQSASGGVIWPGYSSRSLTINNDTPYLYFYKTSQTVNEWSRTAVVYAQIPKAVNHDVTFKLSRSGSARYTSTRFYSRDYYLPDTTWRIPAGSYYVPIPITIFNDATREADETITLKLTSVGGAAIGSPSTYTVTIRDDDTPAKTSTTSIQSGQVAISTSSQPISIGTSTTTKTVTSSSSIGTIGVGTLAISFDGYLSGNTLFFDANRNGVLDFIDLNGDGIQGDDEPSEPSSTTGVDGAVLLNVGEEFDVDLNGVINEVDGVLVSTGGTDTSTGLPLAFPLAGYLNTPAVSPLTTLLTGLVEDYGFDVDSAAERIAQAMNLPSTEFISMDALAATEIGHFDAPYFFAAGASLHNTFTQLAQTLSAAPYAPPLHRVAAEVIRDMAGRITEEDSTLDLQSPAVIDGILRGVLVRIGSTLSDEIIEGAAEVIAAGNQQLAAIPVVNGEDYLREVAKNQVVAQGDVSNALSAAAAGTMTIGDVVSQNTGFALETQVSNATVGVIIPPGLAISDRSVYEGDDGTQQLVLTVAISKAPEQTVTVDFSTQDLTATEEDGDYVATSGTLTWLAGDDSPKAITITTNGDTRFEATELFSVILSNPSNAYLLKDIGFGGLINDEPLSVTVPAGPGPNGAGSQETILQINGEEFELISGGETLITQPATSPAPITITGTDAADDSLVIDLIFGNPLPAGGLTYHGGAGGNDSATINGGDFSQIVQRFTNSSDGVTELTFVDTQATTTFRWFGLEPFLMNLGSVDSLVFELPAGITSAILEDADPTDTIHPGMMQLRSPDGHFKTTIFSNPGSLTIRGGDGADTIVIGELDPSFTGTILIPKDAVGTDRVQVQRSGWTAAGTEIIDNVRYEVSTKGIAPNMVSLKVPFNAAPVADAGGPYSVTEGGFVTLNAGGSFDEEDSNSQLAFEWDLNYDGLTFDVDLAGEQPSLSFPDDFATRNIALRVSDTGGLNAIAVTSLTVTNSQPAATFISTATITYGDVQTVSFADPRDASSNDVASGFRYAYSLTGDFSDTTWATGLSSESFSWPSLNAGVYTVYARIIDKDNGYSQYSASFTVDKATPSISVSGRTEIYDGTAYGATGRAVGVNNEVLAGLHLGEEFTSAPGGMAEWKFLDTTGNYLNADGAVQIVILPRSLAVTASDQSKTYGDNDPLLTFSFGALADGDSSSIFSGSLTRANGQNVGGYAIQQGTLTAGSNYAISFVEATLAISPAPLTVTADPKTKVIGQSDPTLTYRVDGLRYNDTVSSVVSGTLTRQPGETAGVYSIQQGSLTAGTNYSMIFTGSTLTINSPPAVTISTPADGFMGVASTFIFSAADPDAADQAESFTYRIDWGNGNITTLTGAATTSIQYAYPEVSADGIFLISVTVTDARGAMSEAATQAFVVGGWGLLADPVNPGKAILVVVGSQGRDAVSIKLKDEESFKLRIVDRDEDVRRKGTVHGDVDRILVYGHAGNDRITIDDDICEPTEIWGGSGDDDIKGGSGPDIILGEAGDDNLWGGDGRDIIIGGLGADRIHGDAHDDILIAGFTMFESSFSTSAPPLFGNAVSLSHREHRAALEGILSEWTSPRTYSLRRQNIQGTGTGPRNNGNNYLKVSNASMTDNTVFDDNAADRLWGDSGTDWFFANTLGDLGNVLDSIRDRTGNEGVEDLDKWW